MNNINGKENEWTKEKKRDVKEWLIEWLMEKRMDDQKKKRLGREWMNEKNGKENE